jgi:26S proteasome regulatory subunit N6
MAVSPEENTKKLEEAEKIKSTDASKAEEIYKGILTSSPGSNPVAVNNLEAALVGLGQLYRDQKRVDELTNLILQTRDALTSFAKAKVAKLGKYLIYI